jgi:RimJ/RimL family protein N-acetyltransferase
LGVLPGFHQKKYKPGLSLNFITVKNYYFPTTRRNMSDWIKNPTTLTGETVELVSLTPEHFTHLEFLARDQRIWEFYPYDASDPAIFLKVFTAAILEQEKGTQFPFVIYHKPDKKIIGSTRYLDIQPNHRKLEIGATWLQPDYWATAVNLECKLLLLTHCFESLLTIRVQLKTDEKNLRSRKAIEKIGGKFEGIFRNDMIRDNNTRRNSAYYSIIAEEWADKKIKLARLYRSKKAASA